MHTLPAAAAATLGALASTAAAAALLRAALHRYHLQQHSAALTVTTRLACGVAVLALQLQTPAVGDGAFATAAATVLHPEVVLLLARMVLLPLPWKHQLWVQAVEIKAGLASLPRQPASVTCCGFVSAARRALDLLTANGAPLRPPLLGDAPSAFHCCWMARTFMLLLVGVLLPSVVALARAQHAAAVAAWVQAAQLRGRTSMRRSRSEPSLRSNGSSPKSSPEHGSSPKSVQGGMSERSGSSSSSSISSSSGGGNLLREGSPASSASCSPASTASLDQPSSPASSVGSALAAAGRALSEPAAVRRTSSSPGSLASLEQPCPSSAAGLQRLSASASSGVGHSAASVSLAGGQPLSALPAALLSAPLPLSWVQCLLLLLPASAALWAALEVALNAQQAARL